MRERLEGKQYVEQYVHALTHELKGPLAAIRGSAELLDTPSGAQPMPEADRARFIATIREQGERLSQMIDKLLALAAVEYRQRIEHPESVDVAALIDAAAKDVAPKLAQAGVGLQLPAQAADDTVPGDPFLLRQALVNLLENAVDFAPAGSTIEVALHRDGGRLRIDVADRGPGRAGLRASDAYSSASIRCRARVAAAAAADWACAWWRRSPSCMAAARHWRIATAAAQWRAWSCRRFDST